MSFEDARRVIALEAAVARLGDEVSDLRHRLGDVEALIREAIAQAKARHEGNSETDAAELDSISVPEEVPP